MADVSVAGDSAALRDIPPKLSTYSTLAAVRASAEEVTIIFGERDFEDPNIAEPIVRVYLSFAHAMRLAGALVQVLSAIEQTVGMRIDPHPGQSWSVPDETQQKEPNEPHD